MSSTFFVSHSHNANAPDSGGTGNQSPPVRQIRIGRLEKFCPRCEKWIGLGPRGGEYSFLVHQHGKRCRQIQQRKTRKNAAEELERSFGIHPPPTSPTVQAASSSVTNPPPHLPSHEPTHNKPHSPYFPPIINPLVTRSPQLPCRGIQYKWELGNACKTYPFQYHDTGIPTWSARTGPPCSQGDIVSLESHSCTGFRDPSMEACLPCMNIPSSHEFKKVFQMAWKDPPPTTPHIYLSWVQVEKRLRQVNDDVRRKRRKDAALTETIRVMKEKEQLQATIDDVLPCFESP
ncbi:hypothetical protein BDM02DRAFT_1471780 [Thelephora ganbajun]|uniref:Uncharacterized protein n=1 Tax=Thelephora ganbajun TaxID=370292 RepID=A0ACB6Z1P8_THEGA|nr:hypothetical protein BDM02DRAFT_1471780 [Thelephora ganbajun]